MPLPSSGNPISFDDLNSEIGNAAETELDLETAAEEFSINTRPHGMNEFHGLSLTSLTVSPNTFTFNLAGGFKNFTTTTRSGNTVVTDNRTWLSITNRTNSGFRVNASTQVVGASARSGTVTVSNSSDTINIPITQNAYAATLSMTPNDNFSLDSSGTGVEASITSNTAWSFSSVASWIDISSTSGTGNETITIGATAQPIGGGAREDNITLSTDSPGGTDVSITNITISQEAGTAATISVTPSSHSFVGAGSSRTFTVTSNTNWQVTGYPLWIEIDDTTGGGSDTSFVATAEPQELRSDARTSLLIVTTTSPGGTDVSDTVSITQLGRPEWTRTPSSKTWEYDDDLSLSVNIITNLPWSAELNNTSFEARQTISQLWSQGPWTGTGDDIIYVRPSEVPSVAKVDRTGTLTISETSTEYNLSDLTVSLKQEKPPFMGDLFYPYNSTTDRPGWGPGEINGVYENLNFWAASDDTAAYLSFQFVTNRAVTYEIQEFDSNVQIVQPTNDLALTDNSIITRTTRGSTAQFRAKVLAPSAGTNYMFTLEFLTADEPNSNFSIEITLGRTASQSNPPNVVQTVDTQPPTVRIIRQ